ncbi:MAG: exopolysaccharide biosynthesis protein [Opitutaceae bacterium]|nr:exopolysaccharide biosynthesis protein [Opitutaceae bacterium]
MSTTRRRPRPTGHLAQKLSVELDQLRAQLGSRPMTLREVIYKLRGRAYTLLLILLALPFITPIPLPGLSTPFGLAIAFIALRLALGQRPWLPMKLQRKELPPGFFLKVFIVAGKVIALLESFLKPRWAFISAPGPALQVHALFIFIAALVLLLPLPIPFSNSFPAWTILLLAAGMLERDGLFIILGYLCFVLGVLYFILLGEAAERLIDASVRWISG